MLFNFRSESGQKKFEGNLDISLSSIYTKKNSEKMKKVKSLIINNQRSMPKLKM